MRVILAGIVYFVLVYMAGFALGAVRQVVIVPLTGGLVAVLIEAPLMIVAMTLVARWVLRRFEVPPDMASRAALGLAAFALLMLAEAAMSSIIRGWSLAQWLGHFATVEGFISLLLFVLFAAMPMLVRDKEPRAS